MIPAAMKRLSLLLAGCFIAVETFGAAPHPTPRDLRTLSDSLFRWCAAHSADSLADNLSGWWTDERAGCVQVTLLRADSAARSDFRRRVSDSPLMRIEGFDPSKTPYAPAPEGAAPPEELTMYSQRAFYPTGTEHVRLTIRYTGDEAVCFGTDYILCRFQHGRWEVLPVCNAWNSLLIGLGRHNPPMSGPKRSALAEGYTHDFTVWLAPRVFPARYGRYRVCKWVYTKNPRRDYLLCADFTVTPQVPYGPFTQPAYIP